jgi:peptide/nickel transport system substrate-binding protein
MQAIKILCGLILMLALACGGTPAAPEPTATSPARTEDTAPPTTSAPTTVDTPAPTATPQAAAPPTEVEVSTGKVTWMTALFGTERFDYVFSAGGVDYARILHGFFIASDVEEGRRVLVPGIATNWELSNAGLTWTFTIRKGVKFHDGSDLTVDDALWSLQHAQGPQSMEYAISPSPLARIMDRIEQTGPDQVSVTTKEPAPDLIGRSSDADGGWPGALLPKRATLHDVQEEAAYDMNPIGAGIMRLVKHVPADSMTFERFADYYQQPAYGFPADRRVNFTEFDLRLVPEEATRVAALRSGEADIGGVSLAVRNQVEAGGGRVMFGQEGTFFHIHLTACWKPQYPCHDKRVRQALNYAIDKELMRDQLFGGPEVMQIKGWGPVTPSTIGYRPGLDPFPFDPEKARQLLAEAGYPGGEGFGKLVINTYVSSSIPLMPEAAQLGAELWKRELGLDVEVRVGDQAALRNAATLTEDLHGQIFWRDNDTRYDATGNVRSFWGNPDNNRRSHEDPELYALWDKTMSVTDPVELEKALNTAYMRFLDEAYEISLGYFNIPWGVGPRIATWEPYPLATYPFSLHTITLK